MREAGGGEEQFYCGLPLSAVKERVSMARLELVASAAGCSLSDPRVDYDGWDVTVVSHAEFLRYSGPRFDIQLKATSSESVARPLKNGDFSFTLDASTYRKLSDPKRYERALLVVLILPSRTGPAEWAVRHGQELRSPGIMLWADPRDWDAELPPGRESVTVRLSRDDHFDPEFIRALMKEIGDGGGGR
ncbi:DUF4365 domain-containing protein [Streptacidiphilus sp. P02-A3a]|uniref:DUF4365 domain-containing protein n=1 Tax=Streptacidiphilus sp. P02-A3a TaxID=2704468 RepID=UPI0015F90C7C|nr:DUF4365 domain-containing protein [Streptacidiphilus sp. P02-A3a]QMU68290.1 DUF4365 domain-containing protein [Streptacidiphilus sp. P02-A3a]